MYHKFPSTQQSRKEWRAKVSFGRTMMLAMEQLQLAKGTSQDKAMFISEEM